MRSRKTQRDLTVSVQRGRCRTLALLLLAVVLSASVCFATPLGHQVNLMVFGPGGYRFSDFLRLGLPLSVLALGMVVYGLSSQVSP